MKMLFRWKAVKAPDAYFSDVFFWNVCKLQRHIMFYSFMCQYMNMFTFPLDARQNMMKFYDTRKI